MYQWSKPVTLKFAAGRLQSGEVIPVERYKWSGELSSGEIQRWGFRAIGDITEKHFSVEFRDDTGSVIRSGVPALRKTHDSEGLLVVVLEVKGPTNCTSASLSGRANGDTALLVGPLAEETYAPSDRGATLGSPVLLQIPDGHGSVRLEALTVSGQSSTQVHLALQFYGSDGTEIPPVPTTSVSPILGSYVVLRKAEATGWTDTTVILPDGTASVSITPLKSRPEAAVAGILRASTRERDADSLEEFLKELPPGKPLILIDSTAPPFGSGLITIRPNNMTIQYAELGYAVVSVGYGDLQGVDRRLQESVYQAPRSEFADVVEQLAAESRRRPCLYVCSSFPSPSAVVAIDTLRESGWKTLYEIRDDMEEFKRVGYSQWHTAEAESYICRRAQYITAVSPALADKAAALALDDVQATVIPNGIQPRFISKAIELRSLPVVERKRQEGIVGYVGHLTDAWFDWEYYIRLVEALPDNRFEIIGPGINEGLKLPPNVHYLGPKRQDELQEVTARWAVGLVPFKKSPLTRAVDPNKLFEYVAWGMRTVAAEMGSIEDCPTATAYHTFPEMFEAVQRALQTPWTQYELDEAEAFLEASTWRQRAERTLEVVGL